MKRAPTGREVTGRTRSPDSSPTTPRETRAPEHMGRNCICRGSHPVQQTHRFFFIRSFVRGLKVVLLALFTHTHAVFQVLWRVASSTSACAVPAIEAMNHRLWSLRRTFSHHNLPRANLTQKWNRPLPAGCSVRWCTTPRDAREMEGNKNHCDVRGSSATSRPLRALAGAG